MNVFSKTIKLDLKKEYKILVISDTHAIDVNSEMDLIKENGWIQRKKYFANFYNQNYDDKYNKLSSICCLNELIDYSNKEKPDLLIFCGDIIDYCNDYNNQLLKNTLNSISIPYMFVNGNHDNGIDCNAFQVREFRDFVIIGIDNSKKKITEDVLNQFKEYLNKRIILAIHIPI